MRKEKALFAGALVNEVGRHTAAAGVMLLLKVERDRRARFLEAGISGRSGGRVHHSISICALQDDFFQLHHPAHTNVHMLIDFRLARQRLLAQRARCG